MTGDLFQTNDPRYFLDLCITTRKPHNTSRVLPLYGIDPGNGFNFHYSYNIDMAPSFVSGRHHVALCRSVAGIKGNQQIGGNKKLQRTERNKNPVNQLNRLTYKGPYYPHLHRYLARPGLGKRNIDINVDGPLSRGDESLYSEIHLVPMQVKFSFSDWCKGNRQSVKKYFLLLN